MQCICGGFTFDKNGRCKYCGSMAPPSDYPKPAGIIGNDSPNDLIEAMRRARIPKQSDCIKCGKITLSYDERKDQFACLNLECVCYSQYILSKSVTYFEIIDYIKNKKPKSSSSNYVPEIPHDKKQGKKHKDLKYVFHNPSLLQVKMLMSENRSWRREYREREYICSDFTKDVVDFMTSQEIRCGFVTISFDKSDGHAIVAFYTDYGLVYFEPQSGNQVEPQIGKKYHSSSQGDSKDAIITNIEICWNC
jgi:hypothetical protein